MRDRAEKRGTCIGNEGLPLFDVPVAYDIPEVTH